MSVLHRVEGRIYCNEQVDRRRKHDEPIIANAQLDTQAEARAWLADWRAQEPGRCRCGQPRVFSTTYWEPG